VNNKEINLMKKKVSVLVQRNT